MLLSDRIHDALRDAFQAANFPRVTYDPETGKRITSAAELLKVKSMKIKPVQALFDVPRLNRRTRILRERVRWVWLAEAWFDREVDLSPFEDALSANPLRVCREEADGQDAVLYLEETDQRFPPEQQGASGTRATFRFNAELSPI